MLLPASVPQQFNQGFAGALVGTSFVDGGVIPPGGSLGVVALGGVLVAMDGGLLSVEG